MDFDGIRAGMRRNRKSIFVSTLTTTTFDGNSNGYPNDITTNLTEAMATDIMGYDSTFNKFPALDRNGDNKVDEKDKEFNGVNLAFIDDRFGEELSTQVVSSTVMSLSFQIFTNDTIQLTDSEVREGYVEVL